VSDHAATALAVGLTLALGVGIYGERLAQSYRDIWSLRARLRNTKRVMRALRLRWAMWAAVVFAIGYLWIHQYL
jgi:hypothetical protein